MNSMTLKDKPLISFILLTYNQEQFIEEAVLGALSQTYTPLEIVIADDASVDKTYDIIKKQADIYTGPHRIIITRNATNQGLAENLNRAIALSSGLLFVGAAGDDVSLSSRVDMIWRRWEDGGRKAHSIYSAVMVANETGDEISVLHRPAPRYTKDIRRMCKEFMPGCIGASHAWSKEVSDYFGPLSKNVAYEDRVIPLRSLLLGRIDYIEEPLVKYRRHSKAITMYGDMGSLVGDYHRRRTQQAENRMTVLAQWLTDLQKFPAVLADCRQIIEQCQAWARFDKDMETLDFWGRLWAFARTAGKVKTARLVWWYSITAVRPIYNLWIRLNSRNTRNYWTQTRSQKIHC